MHIHLTFSRELDGGDSLFKLDLLEWSLINLSRLPSLKFTLSPIWYHCGSSHTYSQFHEAYDTLRTDGQSFMKHGVVIFFWKNSMLCVRSFQFGAMSMAMNIAT